MRITRIEAQKRNKNRSSVYLDGDFAFGIDDFDLLRLKLAEGMELDEERLSSIRETVLLSAAKNYATRIAARHNYTKAGLERKMEEKGYDAWTIERASAFLEECGLLGDEEYARRYIHDALYIKGCGRYRIERALREKGIAPETVERVFAEFNTDEAEAETIIRLAEKKLGGDFSYQNVMKTKRFLASRGYRYDAIDSAMRKITDGMEEWE